ncbi:T9SS type A sorting domain-containing protein [bacterium]|nr:T9SS type A sorting domain-containing protein [bacterium]
MKKWVVLLTLLAVLWTAADTAASCMTFRWTATGDDGLVGQASYYDIRYSRSGITEANFYSANQVVFPPTPKESGSAEEWTICGLPSLIGYNVAIKVGDEAGNWSPISNVAFLITDDQTGFRGDVNGNGVNYEVGDVIVFTNYFLYGNSVFTVNFADQIAASDVNADGYSLTVADLTYLIRVVVGDASPILHRLNPHSQGVEIETRREGNTIVLSTDAVSTIGTAHLVFDIDHSLEIGIPSTSQAATGMDLNWHRDGDKLRMILYDLGRAHIASGRHDILRIPVSGQGTIAVADAALADFDGRAYASSGALKELPSDFSLAQNYPNPFNPSTTIEYALPSPSRVRVEVFNAMGQAVTTLIDDVQPTGHHQVVWDGTNDDGQTVASGVYFYRLTAGEFTQSRKMLLLK